jgi:hypothetical protein
MMSIVDQEFTAAAHEQPPVFCLRSPKTLADFARHRTPAVDAMPSARQTRAPMAA